MLLLGPTAELDMYGYTYIYIYISSVMMNCVSEYLGPASTNIRHKCAPYSRRNTFIWAEKLTLN